MATESPTGEKMAGAMPLAIGIASIIIIILATEVDREFGEGNSFCLMRVTFSFFDLANQA
jgi:hypothetical protein